MLPTTDRVPDNTTESVNARMRRQTRERVARAAAIARRLRELDEEWDKERAQESNASTLVAAGSALALLVDRRFAILPLVVGGILVQHALQGWCPPLPIIRRLGYRTRAEIEQERHALKAVRGDFAGVQGGGATGDPQQALRAVGV